MNGGNFANVVFDTEMYLKGRFGITSKELQELDENT